MRRNSLAIFGILLVVALVILAFSIPNWEDKQIFIEIPPLELSSDFDTEKAKLLTVLKKAEESGNAEHIGPAAERLGHLHYFIGYVKFLSEFNRPEPWETDMVGWAEQPNYDFLVGVDKKLDWGKEAEAYFSKASESYEKATATRNQAWVFRYMGLLFDKTNDADKERAYNAKSQVLFEKYGTPTEKATSHSDQAYHAAFRSYDYPEAFKHLALAEKFYTEAGHDSGLAQTYFNWADLLDPQRFDGEYSDVPKMEEYFKKSVDLWVKLENYDAAVRTYGKESQIFIENKNNEKAVEYFDEAMKIVEAHFEDEHKKYNFEIAIDFFKEHGHPEKAQLYQKKLDALP